MPIRRPPAWIGLLAAVLAVTLATLAIYPLARIARPASLSVVYLPAVLVIAAYWGLRLGLLTSVASALARGLLAGDRTHDALRTTARRLAEALDLSSATLELGEVPGNERHVAGALAGGTGAGGTGRGGAAP